MKIYLTNSANEKRTFVLKLRYLTEPKVVHTKEGQVDHFKVWDEHTTVAQIYEIKPNRPTYRTIAEGVSFCSKGDKYDKATGRLLAVTRAIAHFQALGEITQSEANALSSVDLSQQTNSVKVA